MAEGGEDQSAIIWFGERTRSPSALPLRRAIAGATLSITNNIAEGSGSDSQTDFAHYLNMARRSAFEVANILLLLSVEGCWPEESVRGLLGELQEQSRMLRAFQRTLRTRTGQEPPR